MTKTIFTHKVEDVSKWKSLHDERARNMGAFGDDIQSYVDKEGGNQVAVSMNLTDPEGFRKFMQSETAGAIFQKHGVIAPINMLVSGA